MWEVERWGEKVGDGSQGARRVMLRRAAYWTVCAGLLTLIILTIVFVGDDTTTVQEVTAEGSSTTAGPSTTEFALSLPVGVTATTFVDGTTPSSASSNSATTTTTINSGVPTSSTTTTTTQPQPPFQYTLHPKQAPGNFTAAPPGCPSMNKNFSFDTPNPGSGAFSVTDFDPAPFLVATGSVNAQGKFDVTGTSGNITEHIFGTTTQTMATGTIHYTDPSCDHTYFGQWVFD